MNFGHILTTNPMSLKANILHAIDVKGMDELKRSGFTIGANSDQSAQIFTEGKHGGVAGKRMTIKLSKSGNNVKVDTVSVDAGKETRNLVWDGKWEEKEAHEAAVIF